MRTAALLVSLLWLALSGSAAAAEREEAPEVELYTMGMGELVWEKWGHAALCLRYESPRDDVCYNYGTTNFADPLGLGWGFLRGEPVFWVSSHRPAGLLRPYVKHDRTVWRQRIPVTPEAARQLAKELRVESRPENRTYRYHHFHDNCSTRVRDLVDEATGGALSRAAGPPPGPTFRDYAERGFAGMPSLLMVNDLLLGRPADAQPDEYALAFHPDELRRQVHEHLGVEPEVLYERRGPPFPTDPGQGKLWWLLVALVVGLPAIATRLLGRYQRLGLALSAVPLALLGAIVWGMALVSQMPELRFNEAIFVFMPWDLALAIGSPRAREGYARARILFLVLLSLLLAVGVLEQPLWLLIPVALLPQLAAAR